MPQDLLVRVKPRLDAFFPPYLAVRLEVLAECRRRGADYWLTRGPASWGEQDALYAQGRTLPGPVVTDARGGDSAHNYGIADDSARDALPDVPKLQPTWRREDYLLQGEVAEEFGLTWGGRFKRFDGPHVQWPGYVTAKQLLPLRALVGSYGEVEGMARVWELLQAEMETADWQRANPRLADTLRRLDFLPRLTASVA